VEQAPAVEVAQALRREELAAQLHQVLSV
jgi:hypothetical protein